MPRNGYSEAQVKSRLENGVGVYLHGHNTRNSRTYRSWASMIQRITNPNATGYKWYGAIGIKICTRWKSFVKFLEDMGERPQGMSLDRINPYGNYTPYNTRWSDPKTQTINQRRK